MNSILQRKIENIIIAWGFCLIAVNISMFFFLHMEPFGNLASHTVTTKEIIYKLFGLCILAPFVEEALFRYGPMTIIRHRPDYEKIKIPIIIMGSIIFGWIHGDEENVMIQGVCSLAFYWVYIKNGHSYMSSVITHSLYNFSVFIGMIVF